MRPDVIDMPGREKHSPLIDRQIAVVDRQSQDGKACRIDRSDAALSRMVGEPTPIRLLKFEQHINRVVPRGVGISSADLEHADRGVVDAVIEVIAAGNEWSFEEVLRT